MTEKAVMWLHDCLDAKKNNKTRCSQICRHNLSNQCAEQKGSTAISKTNCNTLGGGAAQSSEKRK